MGIRPTFRLILQYKNTAIRAGCQEIFGYTEIDSQRLTFNRWDGIIIKHKCRRDLQRCFGADTVKEENGRHENMESA